MKKELNLILVLLFFVFGCNSNNPKAKVRLSADSLKGNPVKQENDRADNKTAAGPADSLSLVLRELYRKDIDKNLLDSAGRRFIYSTYDLNGDGKSEILIGLTGTYFCGSGGCTVLLLDQHKHLLTRISVADYPFTVSSVATNGWKDLIVRSAGKLRVLKFGDRGYPSNPSVEPEFKGTSVGADKLLELPQIPDQWQHF